jgi:hypothetical protein
VYSGSVSDARRSGGSCAREARNAVADLEAFHGRADFHNVAGCITSRDCAWDAEGTKCVLLPLVGAHFLFANDDAIPSSPLD